MIDIIIPAYNAHKTIKETLCSIAFQENKENIKVYIVNDNSDTDYNEEIEIFKKLIDIKELKLNKNMGPGYARQYGIDHSNSKYIIFMDADDCFANCFSAKILEESIKKGNKDIVISNFYEQQYDDELIEHINDVIFLHGKIYKRKYLKDNNIKFNNTRENEDNGFNQLVFLHNAKDRMIDDFTYIWKYNEGSITTRNNFEYAFTGLHGYIYNMTWAIENAIKDKCDVEKISIHIYAVLIQIYFYYIEYINRKDVEELLYDSKKLYKFHCKYPIKSMKDKEEIWNVQYQKKQETINMEELDIMNSKISFTTFLNMIEKIK